MKKPISATIDVKLLKWIDSQLKDSLTYRNKSHLIEIALINLKKLTDEGEGRALEKPGKKAHGQA